MGLLNFFKRKIRQENVGKNTNGIKCGLALGSGGTRGFAHLGVLKAFEDEGISFDYVAGTSAGSIAAALYAAGYKVQEIVEVVNQIPAQLKSGLIPFIPSTTVMLESVLRRYIGNLSFEDLPRAFSCVAVDLLTSEEVVFSSGDLVKCVCASCSVPPLFKPVVYNGMHLVDGAFSNPIPSNVVRKMGAEIVVSVEVNATRGVGTTSLNPISVWFAATRIATRSTADEGIINSDVMLNPELKEYKSTSFKNINEVMKTGYDCAYEKMSEIKKLLGYKNYQELSPKGAPVLRVIDIKKKNK